MNSTTAAINSFKGSASDGAEILLQNPLEGRQKLYLGAKNSSNKLYRRLNQNIHFEVWSSYDQLLVNIYSVYSVLEVSGPGNSYNKVLI